jgi:hypothetical protein
VEQFVKACEFLFEFVITDEQASFGVFDTHHNQLLYVRPASV